MEEEVCRVPKACERAEDLQDEVKVDPSREKEASPRGK